MQPASTNISHRCPAIHASRSRATQIMFTSGRTIIRAAGAFEDWFSRPVCPYEAQNQGGLTVSQPGARIKIAVIDLRDRWQHTRSCKEP